MAEIDNAFDEELGQELSMGAKLLLEMRTHRTESKGQFKAVELRLEGIEQRLDHQEEQVKELNKQYTWGKGIVRGVTWLGAFALIVWGLFFDGLRALATLLPGG